ALRDRQLSRPRPADPPGHDQARQREGREHGRDNADTQRHREAAYRPRADKEQHGSRNEGGDIGIEDGGERAGEARIDRVDGSTSAAHLLPDTFIDQDVAVHRNPDGQNNADDAGQRERRIEQREDAEDHPDIDADRDAREYAEQSVSENHEYDDEGRAEIGREFSLLDRILAQPRAHDALLDHGKLRRQGARTQQDGKIVGGFDREIAGDLSGS